jgi:hypothetical protein
MHKYAILQDYPPHQFADDDRAEHWHMAHHIFELDH